MAERLRQSVGRKISSPASAAMNSPSCSTASRAPRTSTRWSRGSISAAHPVRLLWPSIFQRRQHRHRDRAARRLGPVRSPEERRSRDVCGEGGRPSNYRFFDPAMEQQANHRRELEADLRAALAEGSFELHYQPQVDLRSDASPAARRCCAGGIRCAAWFRRPTSCRSPRKPA